MAKEWQENSTALIREGGELYIDTTTMIRQPDKHICFESFKQPTSTYNILPLRTVEKGSCHIAKVTN